MEGKHTYDHILKQKLDQLEAPDMNFMWEDMHAILDEKMPQEKKRRFFIWFVNRNMIISMVLAVCSITVSWYAITTKWNSPEIISAVKEKQEDKVSETIKTGSKERIPGSNEIKEYRPTSSQPQKQSVKNYFQAKNMASEISHILPIHSNETLNEISTIDEYNFDQVTSLRKINSAASPLPADINSFPGANAVQLRLVNVDPQSLKVQPDQRKKRSYFVAGLAINYHMPLSGQEMSTLSSFGNENRVTDYLPSVFTQYHLNDKWYIQAEFQYTSPQYIQPVKMASTYTPINANKKKEEWVSLSKLYYLNVPVSIHYKPAKNLSVGTGIQYSYLRNSIIETNVCIWEDSNNSWSKTYEKKQVHVRSNPGQEKRRNINNPATPLTSVDTLAQTLRSNDWRIVLDVNYKWKKFTGGARFNTGLNNYIDISSSGISTSLRDKNEAFQLYLRYDLFRSDRKRKPN